jgi:hypothetical protein
MIGGGAPHGIHRIGSNDQLLAKGCRFVPWCP